MIKNEAVDHPSRGVGSEITIALRHSESNSHETKGSIWRDLLAGGVAGTAAVAVGHPFDTVKVRLQQLQQQPAKLNSSAAMVRGSRASFKNGKPSLYRGLYRGIGAPLATAALVNASIFCVYGATSRLWDKQYTTTTAPVASSIATTITKQAFCGGLAGLFTSLLLSPVDLVKIRLQTLLKPPKVTPRSSSPLNLRSKSSFFVAKQILSSEYGIRGLYRGLFATILRQVPSFTIYFPTYHFLKESIGGSDDNANNNSSWASSALAGGRAGRVHFMGNSLPNGRDKKPNPSPADDATTKKRSFYHEARNTFRNEGFSRLMFSRGLFVTLLRAFPVNGTIFFVYELVNERLLVLDNYCYDDYD
eukprot:CAMPEP_0168248108 /NCGR_PEP_ID=MMETSP0141_2-20121125/1277_1 /TAXON_ID=44445 /ORGANISM="Pseudo-nitzschia australis, Strain 10249 10 AB" /LENGTH=360 /DNA_ID=CAMNT_0008183983 /DNA_START=140 /DNA_END=1223 /DNA_ORIENTATION=-